MDYPSSSKKRTASEALGEAPAKLQQPDADDIVDDVEASTTHVAKKQKVAARAAAAAVPVALQQKQVRSKYIFYPDTYDTCDMAKLSFAKDPQTSNDGSGEILFMSYLFDDGLQPLLIQTPNAMHSPTGITVWKDGKCSVLLSAGRDWENMPLMVKFKALIDAIQLRCWEMICEKTWNKGGKMDPAVVEECFTNLMFVGEDKEKCTPYPPSIKATVLLDGSSKAELFEKVVGADGAVMMNCLIPSDVGKGCGMTAIIHVPWIFRKKAKKGFTFSIRATLYQARVFPAAAGNGPSRAGCAIVD